MIDRHEITPQMEIARQIELEKEKFKSTEELQALPRLHSRWFDLTIGQRILNGTQKDDEEK